MSKKKLWLFTEADQLFKLPFNDLIYQAHQVHRQHFNHNIMQISILLNIKTGSCPEDCSYCPQSAHYKTDLEKEALMSKQSVIDAAKRAKAAGSTRFCLGAAWRGPKDKDLDSVCEMIKEIKILQLESCVTLGLLEQQQALKLKEAGLDYYNHNIDTSPTFYDKIITTRNFEDRLNTLKNVEEAGINVCCGGILGMGENNEDRINMLLTLANMHVVPKSVPINQLIPIPGTPLEKSPPPDPFDIVRIVALSRIMMPKSTVRLTAGRSNMSDELQSLCFFAGANSIFYGEKLLTAKNSAPARDDHLLTRLGIDKMEL
ncbi:MAG: biotin synthase BioB [Rickettsiaceae bacterium]|nr:MAG: biotin synthase BioB [Rickettsiaceae bacterium]